MESILVVDDEPDFAQGLARLILSGFPEARTRAVTSGAEALALLAQEPPDLLLTDLRMPGMDGQELLRRSLELVPGLTVILLTGHGSVETAVAALKSGAYDFLTKPVERETLHRVVGKGLERSRLLGENRRLRELTARCGAGQRMVGDTPAMRRLKEAIAAVAASDYTVLIRGESGTGKELAATCIHEASSRSQGPFVSVNCSAIPEALLESELFGHVRGAFTGADRARRGLFVAASGGTLLLDEIGDMPAPLQVKLLRVLQEREVRPVGSSQTVRVDARILASTNQDLEARIAAGAFREDLFYRLNVLTLRTPPLSERKADIPLLAAHFLDQACRELSQPAKRLPPEVMAALAGRDWPGNVRELQNFVRRMTVFCPGGDLDMACLSLAGGGAAAVPEGAAGAGMAPYKEAKSRLVEDFTRRYVAEVLTRTGGNVSEAARVSGIERVSLQKIIRRMGLDPAEFRGAAATP